MPDLASLAAVPALDWTPAFEDADVGHRLTLLALVAFSAIWVTALGAAVGSFSERRHLPIAARHEPRAAQVTLPGLRLFDSPDR